jgi:hypothetical protein
MTNINFDEPSVGTVNDRERAGLEVKNTADRRAIGIIAEVNGGRSKGVYGKGGDTGIGIYGEGKFGAGVHGENIGGGPGVFGNAVANTTGVFGQSEGGIGVHGNCLGGTGVHGTSNSGVAVKGVSQHIGILGTGPVAGRFEGNVEVTGLISLKGDLEVGGDVRLIGADCAEEFDISEVDGVNPGTVMVLDNSGNLQQSQTPYDKKVAGIVSGAGIYKPALILDKKQDQEDKIRLPIALVGKVYCKVEASTSPIEIGDLLTTSTLKGHAMKAQDPYKAFGSVIGKALGSLKDGVGMIPVLVALQ